MKKPIIALCAGLILVLSGCSVSRVDIGVGQTKTVSVGSPMLHQKVGTYGNGNERMLIYAGATDTELKLTQASQNYATVGTRWIRSDPLQTELSYKAIFPQDITYQGYKLRIEKADSNGITYTILELPSGIEYKE